MRNDIGAHGGPGASCWEAPCDGPVVSQPQGAIRCIGEAVTLCVSANSYSEPLTYQWRFHGAASNGVPVNIVGATTNCLSLVNLQLTNSGYYSILVSTPFGSKATVPVPVFVRPICTEIKMYAGIGLVGQIGQPYCIQYVTNLNQTNWTTLTNFTLTPEYFFLDRESPSHPKRFYRAIEGPCP